MKDMADKKQQRALLAGRLSSLGAAEIGRISRVICEQFIKSPIFEEAKLIMAYMAIANEADPSLIMDAAFAAGKAVAVPVVDYQAKKLRPAVISEAERFEKDKYGILTPVYPECIDISSIDAVIVPGLGFDRDGNRLGRGGGYYDKFLSEAGFRAMTCGFACEEQVLEKIQVAPHDRKVEYLFTQAGCSHISPQPSR